MTLGPPLLPPVVPEMALVSAGAVGGALLRFASSEAAKRRDAGPLVILALNILGSFALGSLSGNGAARRQQLLLGVGFCGAFTTFSTFSMDTITMIQHGQFRRAAAYVLASNTLSLGAAYAGYCFKLPTPMVHKLRAPLKANGG